jgi:serine/threonine-protein kinase
MRAPSRKSRVLKTPLSSRIKTIAVMPFANTSDDPDMEYLSDGVTESIIHSLSRVGKRLRVTARSTVFTYKNKPYTPQQLAAELGVAVVVDGRVQRVRGEIVISIELIDTRNGSQMWGDRFRKPFSDIFVVQDEISAQISDQLKLQLSPNEKKRLVVAGTQKSEAYELYLKGCFYVNKRTIEGVERAIQNFEKAIEIDPSYALAHAGLADCHVILGSRFLAPPDEGYKRAAVEARRAAELDPTLAEPHATIGNVSFSYEWDWEGADRAFRHALLLNPRYATAHHWYSIFLCWMGRMEESLREARVAIEIEPLSTIMNLNYADLLYFAGRSEEALSHVSNTVDFESHFLAHLLIGRIYALNGRYDEALTEVGTAIMLEGRYPELLATLGSIYGMMGDSDRARKIVHDLQDMAAEKFVAPIFFAEVYAAIGDLDLALKHAEAFLAMRGDLGELVAGPRFEKLRGDPRYDEMLARLNFPARLTADPSVHGHTAKL